MKCMFQLIDQHKGVRSKPIGATREEFAIHLSKMFPPQMRQDYIVLVVFDTAKEDWDISLAPLMSVETFISIYGLQEVLKNE